MLSEIKAQIRHASLSNALNVLHLVETFQGETRRVYDAVFIHCANSEILSALNELSTSSVMIEVEISETRKFFPKLTEVDLHNRFNWISEDIRRIQGCLDALNHQLWLSGLPEANILKIQIERLLE